MGVLVKNLLTAQSRGRGRALPRRAERGFQDPKLRMGNSKRRREAQRHPKSQTAKPSPPPRAPPEASGYPTAGVWEQRALDGPASGVLSNRCLWKRISGCGWEVHTQVRGGGGGGAEREQL